LKYLVVLLIAVVMLLTIDRSLIDKIVGRIKRRIAPVKIPSDAQRIIAELPKEAEKISVETALNSRCNSDYDGNQKYVHWGMFDPSKKLSAEQIKRVVSLVKIPRFTDKRVEIQVAGNVLTFVIGNTASGLLRDRMMVESGMQQQAIGLICAALGVGMVFKNLGKDGTSISSNDYGTVKVQLDAMKPSYNGSYWSDLPPIGRRRWVGGNLQDPLRQGNIPLVASITKLTTKNKGLKKTGEREKSQLFWAARGRTPHFYKSKPWGMTIPIWTDEFELSSIYLISNNKLFEYSNWESNKPTHSLKELSKISEESSQQLSRAILFGEEFLVIGRNDDFARALWEIGYQLLNLLVQSHALGISYSALLLDEEQKALIQGIGIKNPIALMAIK